MIVEPDRYLEEFAKCGADTITVHLEACNHIHRTLQKIRSLGIKAGVAINPGTPINQLEDILHDADMFLLMSVNPGFGGQKFIPQTTQKVWALKRLLVQHQSKAIIEVDGGVDENNILELIEAGADVLVAGSSVFNKPSPLLAIQQLKNARN